MTGGNRDRQGIDAEQDSPKFFGGFVTIGRKLGEGAVVDTYLAYRQADPLKKPLYVIRVPKLGNEDLFREEFDVRQRTSEDLFLAAHMPRYIAGSLGSPQYLVVEAITYSQEPIPLFVKRDEISVEMLRIFADELLQYIHHWHDAGYAIGDLGKGRGVILGVGEIDPKYDRFLAKITNNKLFWWDLDANNVDPITDSISSVAEVAKVMHDLDSFHRAFLWIMTLSNQPIQKSMKDFYDEVIKLNSDVHGADASLEEKARASFFERRNRSISLGRFFQVPPSRGELDKEKVRLRVAHEKEMKGKTDEHRKKLREMLIKLKDQLQKAGIPFEEILRAGKGDIPKELGTEAQKKLFVLCEFLSSDQRNNKALVDQILRSKLELSSEFDFSSIFRQLLQYEDQISKIRASMYEKYKVTPPGSALAVIPDENRYSRIARAVLSQISSINALPDHVVEKDAGSVILNDYHCIIAMISELFQAKRGLSSRSEIEERLRNAIQKISRDKYYSQDLCEILRHEVSQL